MFCISLGMCGLTIVSMGQAGKAHPGFGRVFENMLGFDMVAMVLSAVGIPVTALIWVAMTVVSRLSNKN